jgi:hypothetical protein
MAKTLRTSVILTPEAQKIKVKNCGIYGLKNILSAGLLLFGRLSSDQQKDIIAQANGEKPATDPLESQEDLVGKILTKQLADRVQFVLQEQVKRQGKAPAKPRAKHA